MNACPSSVDQRVLQTLIAGFYTNSESKFRITYGVGSVVVMFNTALTKVKNKKCSSILECDLFTYYFHALNTVNRMNPTGSNPGHIKPPRNPIPIPVIMH